MGGAAAPCIDGKADGAGTGTVGITDSSQARLFVGSSALSLFSTSTMSYLAATCVAFGVRCSMLPAQMLVSSTVVRSWKEDSAEPKKLRMLMILALSTNDQQDMFDHSVNALLKENLHAVLDFITDPPADGLPVGGEAGWNWETGSLLSFSMR